MKNIFNQIYRFVFIASVVVFASSCSNDQDVFSSYEEEDQILSQRSQSSCNNLLVNGDFTNFTEPSPCNEVDAFGEGRVSDWENAFGSPDLYSVAGWEFCNVCQTPQPHAARMYSDLGNYEGILQKVDIIQDPDIYYSLCFEAASFGSNIAAYFTNGIASPGANTPGGTNQNLPNLTNDFQITSSPVSTGGECLAFGGSYVPYTIDQIRPDKNYEQIIIFDNYPPNAPGAGITHVRNIVLNCHSDLLEAIKYEETSECTYLFQPQMGGTLNVLEYIWDFGDGSTSNIEAPTHTYSSPGIYTVSLTIKDDNGCCTTVETAVFCGEEPVCVTYLCWEYFMNHFDCASGVKLELPSGVIIDVPFVSMPNPLECYDLFYSSIIPAERNVTGGHCEIKQLLIQAITSTGYDVVIIDYDNAIQKCMKGGAELPGYFVTSEVKVIGVYGTDCNGNPDNDLAKFEFIGCH